MSEPNKRVAIIGGGYAGYALARNLDDVMKVTLIEPRDGFVHNVAAIRATVVPELADKIVYPYSRLLKNGQVMRARAQTILHNGVELTDGRHVMADYVVVATGSRYAVPFKPKNDDTSEFRQELVSLGRRIVGIDHVIIVGAGAVGVELAGEIKAVFPRKVVSLISDTDRLFPRYPQKLHDSLVSKLTQLDVRLYLGKKVVSLETTSAPFEGEVTLQDGQRLAGLVIPAIGSRIDGGPAHQLEGVSRRPNGQLVVDPWMRPSPLLPNVFGIGDLVDAGDGMTVVALMRQVPWLAKAIRGLARGRAIEKIPPYKPWPMPPILLPLGPKIGASVLPLSKKGTVVGDRVTASLKGKTLFLPRYNKEFGLK